MHTPSLIIRRAQMPDLPAIADIWYEKTVLAQSADPHVQIAPDGRERWQDAIMTVLDAHDTTRVWVCEYGTFVVGYLIAEIRPNLPGLLPETIGVILDFALDQHRYLAGAGKLLLGAAHAWFSGQNVTLVQVAVLHHHAAEQAFWRAQQTKEWMDCLLLTMS